jgi:hypothetical protein
MFELPEITDEWSLSDLERDMAFAARAALYLESQGLDHSAVVQCLIDEFDLDRDAARELALMAA